MDKSVILPKRTRETMLCSNLEDIKSRFAILLQSVRSALEANHVASADVHGVLIEMFGCGDCLPKTNLEEIFATMTNNRLWDYIHHSPVEKLLSRFIPDHRASLMSEYKAHLSGFYTTSKLIDYIDCTNINSTEEKSTLDLDKLTDIHYKKLKVKLELTDRIISTLSLKYVQDLWEEFAEEFDIPFLTAVIESILSGSLQITWLISPEIANKITAAGRESSFFHNHPAIIYVAINDTILYDEALECITDFTSKLKRELTLYCMKENLEEDSIPESDIMNLINSQQQITFDHMHKDSVSNTPSYVVSIKSDAALHHATTGSRERSRLTADICEQVKEGATTIKSRLATGIPLAGFFYGLLAGLTALVFTQDGLYSTITEIVLAGVLTAVVTVTVIDHTTLHVQDLNVLPFRQFFDITIVVLMLVCPPIVIIALVENLTDAITGETVGNYGRAVTVGIISGAAVTIFDTRGASTLVKAAVNYTYILLIASAIVLGIFGIYILVSIVAATAGAYVGAAMYVSIIGCVVGASSEVISDMVRKVSKVIAIGAFIGASIGALTGIVSGAIIGGIVGALLSETESINNNMELLEIFSYIEPYSISVRLIALPIKAVLKILRPVANVMNVIIGFITSRRTAVFRVVGAIIGAVIGAYAGVIGGACIGVIIAGFTAGLFSICYFCTEKLVIGGAILAIGSLLSGFREQVTIPILKDIGTIVDRAVFFILVGTVTAVILSIVCSLASSYFITAALIGKFGPYVSDSIGKVVAFSEAITGNFNIASSGFTGGLVGGIIVGIYRARATNNLRVTEFEAYALGVVGAIAGFFTTRIDNVIGNTLWAYVRIPAGAAVLGAFSGLIGGALIVIAMLAMEMLAETAVTKVGGTASAMTAMIGGFIGSIVGSYFTFSMIFSGLIGIAFSMTSVALLTVIVYTVRQNRNAKGICIPLNDIIANFGEAVLSNRDQREAANSNWVQYKILHKIKL